jgi:hypothetical protein
MRWSGVILVDGWAMMVIWDIGEEHMRNRIILPRECPHLGSFETKTLIVLSFRAVFRGFSGGWANWLLPVLYTVCRDLRVFAIRADIEDKGEGKSAEKLEDAARTLNKMFTLCLSDRYGTMNH